MCRGEGSKQRVLRDLPGKRSRVVFDALSRGLFLKISKWRIRRKARRRIPDIIGISEAGRSGF